MAILKNAGWLVCAGAVIAVVTLSRDGSTTRAAVDLFRPSVAQTIAAP